MKWSKTVHYSTNNFKQLVMSALMIVENWKLYFLVDVFISSLCKSFNLFVNFDNPLRQNLDIS